MDVTSWTNNMIAALIQIRGEGAQSPQGHRLPMITPLDTIAVLGRYAPMLVASIEGLQRHHDVPTGAADTQYVSPEGFLTGGVVGPAKALAGRISVATYLAGYGHPSDGAERAKERGGTYYAFYISNGLIGSGETALAAAHREAVREWQRGINASVAAILASPLDLTRPIAPVDNAAFWSAVRGLAASLDAIRANPPEDVFSRVKAATQAALDDTSKFVGKAAAQVADQVGRTAGNVADGFFSEAGITSILVAGLAVFLFVR